MAAETSTATDRSNRAPWLVLAYQFPEGPGSLRVKIWRRLQSIGAVAVKNSMYVLPMNEQSHEDFEWVLGELTSGGAEGAILECRFLDGLTDAQVRALFNTARDGDYMQLVEEIRDFLSAPEKADGLEAEAARDARRLLTRARKRIAEIEAIDFFGAERHADAESVLRELAELLTEENRERGESDMARIPLDDLKDRTWVTRRNVRVDRIASAWLIRRWIDPNARFKFVPSRGYEPAEGELRFDMFEAEFTHEGDRCTFEVLAGMVRPEDEALGAVAEIVHDIDLKDGRFGRPETQGIASVLTGIVTRVADDAERIEQGGQIFEDLYRSFAETAA